MYSSFLLLSYFQYLFMHERYFQYLSFTFTGTHWAHSYLLFPTDLSRVVKEGPMKRPPPPGPREWTIELQLQPAGPGGPGPCPTYTPSTHTLKLVVGSNYLKFQCFVWSKIISYSQSIFQNFFDVKLSLLFNCWSLQISPKTFLEFVFLK